MKVSKQLSQKELDDAFREVYDFVSPMDSMSHVPRFDLKKRRISKQAALANRLKEMQELIAELSNLSERPLEMFEHYYKRVKGKTDRGFPMIVGIESAIEFMKKQKSKTK